MQLTANPTTRAAGSVACAAAGISLLVASVQDAALQSLQSPQSPQSAQSAPPAAARAPTQPPEDSARPPPGWVVVNCAAETFTLEDGVIVSTGKPTGVLRSDRMYENFVLEVEWRHLHAGGNAGIFVWSDPLPARGVPFTRSIEVQVLDGTESPDYTSHGDLFAIHGASCVPDRPHPNGWQRCLPDERRAKPSPEWNRYLITAQDGRIELAVNGKVVSGVSQCSPRKGYLCLEAEGSECHFRIVRLEELPPSQPPIDPAHVALEAGEGWTSLFCGIDLRGFVVGEEQRGHWQAHDSVLTSDGEGGGLATSEAFSPAELCMDWKLPPAGAVIRSTTLSLFGVTFSLSDWIDRADRERNTTGAAALRRPKPREWNRLAAVRAGDRVRFTVNDLPSGEMPLGPRAGMAPIVLNSNAPAEFANLFVRPSR